MKDFIESKILNIKASKIKMFDILMCFSSAIDLVSPKVSGHHNRVAYISLKIANQYGLEKSQIDKLVMAACIHDIGSLELQERYDILKPDYVSNGRHEEIGYHYTSESKIFNPISEFIRYHHKEWNYGQDEKKHGIKISIESQILHLADRIDTYIDKDKNILFQVDDIVNKTIEKSGRDFNPELVESFVKLSTNESFWLYLISDNLPQILNVESKLSKIKLNIEDYRDLAKWFSRFIDFRSKFTSVHSMGVAQSAKIIATNMKLSKKNIQLIEIAGFLHDIGKLSVPNTILEKEGKLSEMEFAIMRSHTFYTYKVLSNIKQFEIINKYASYHHERLDGNGYPFHIKGKDMLIGSRVLAVADIFTAISEDRPYRKGMNKEEIIDLLTSKGDNKHLDSKIVKIALESFDEIQSEIKDIQQKKDSEYQFFWNKIK